MWDLRTLKKLNDERVAYLKKKKREKEAIRDSVKEIKTHTIEGP